MDACKTQFYFTTFSTLRKPFAIRIKLKTNPNFHAVEKLNLNY